MSIDWNDPYYGEQYVSGRITPPTDWQARATAAEAGNAKLRKALEPFAEQADMYDSGCEQHSGQCPDSALAGELPSLTVGDFRRARAALETDNG